MWGRAAEAVADWHRGHGGQISDIQVSGQSEDMTAKEKLLLWSQRMVEDYQGLRCDNFSSSWRDGRLFNAIIHRHKWVPTASGSVGASVAPCAALCYLTCHQFLQVPPTQPQGHHQLCPLYHP